MIGTLLGLSSAPARAEMIGSIQFQESYAGAHPQEFAQLLDQAKIVVPGAVAYITGQWGLPNTLHQPFLVTILDVPSKDPARQMAAYVRAVTSGDELRQVMVMDLEHHMLYPNDNLDNLIYHEMAHAILRDVVTNPAAAPIPTWFNEGLAQSVTTEGTQRTQEDFKRWGHSDARAVALRFKREGGRVSPWGTKLRLLHVLLSVDQAADPAGRKRRDPENHLPDCTTASPSRK